MGFNSAFKGLKKE